MDFDQFEEITGYKNDKYTIQKGKKTLSVLKLQELTKGLSVSDYTSWDPHSYRKI